jgi:molybdopterin converting factor small subunit
MLSSRKLFLKIHYCWRSKKDCTAEQVLELLAEKFPQAAPILKSTRLANEDEYVGKQTLLTDGAEYCLIPPVSGG